jgi:hypothetical protein
MVDNFRAEPPKIERNDRPCTKSESVFVSGTCETGVSHAASMDGFTATQGQQSLLNLEGTARGLWGKNSTGTIKKQRDEWDP